MKKVNKGIQKNDIEDVHWWLGELFTTLCENKEAVDPKIYAEIINLKNSIKESVSSVLFIYSTFKNKKQLEMESKVVLNILESRISELKYQNKKLF